MKSVRKFFGQLCGGSGRTTEGNKDDSPVDPPKETEKTNKNQEVPTLQVSTADGGNEQKSSPNHSTAKSSYDSLNESPSFRHQQKVIDVACSVNCIYDVSHWKPEVLGVARTDAIFQDARTVLEPFSQQCQHLSTLLLNFARKYSRDKRPDFGKCYQVYVSNKSGEDSRIELAEKRGSPNILDPDLQDPTMKELKVVADTGKELLDLIDSIKPKINEKIEEAVKQDVKDPGKEKGEDDGHQGLLSKFAAPGKYRRNLKQLRENRRLLDSIHCEVKSIILTIEGERQQFVSDDTENESLEKFGSRTLLSIVAAEAPVAPDHVELAADVNTDPVADHSHTAHVDEEPVLEIRAKDPENEKLALASQEDSPTLPVDAVGELVENGHASKTDGPPKGEMSDKDEVTKNSDKPTKKNAIPEREIADIIEPLRPASPLSLGSKGSDSLERVDIRKLLDFGSYVLVDPSAQDEVVLQRSRSLDSLCSVTSRRTLSRYGSYEFVTDFEIKIAEKAEDERQKAKFRFVEDKVKILVRGSFGDDSYGVDAPSKMSIISEQKSSRTIIIPVLRSASSPIYKYTEVDYNPFY